jgi:hypothetical protein
MIRHIRERLDNRAFNLNGAVFLGHVLRASLYGVVRAVARSGLVLLVWAASLPRQAHAALAYDSETR